MKTFRDFNTNIELEQFQKDNDIKVIGLETIQEERWVSEYFLRDTKYSTGWRKYNAVRLFFEFK